ncbi:MAG: acetylornithine deacetylase, partial [Planctomycetales bacterium 12-60-4]
VNITPPQSICTVAFRPMPGQNPELLLDRARLAAERLGLDYQVTWRLPPLYTDPRSPFIKELLELTGTAQPQTVAFGTDGSMFSAVQNIAVCGPGSIRQAHTDDEWLSLDQLEQGVDLFERAIRRWCTSC